MPANRSGAKPVKSKPVALRQIDVKARIQGVLAETWLSLFFYNSEKVNIEASFCFPLAAGAVITDLIYAVDTVTSSASVDDANTAFETYDNALEEGEPTFLLEKLECDIAALSVGNLAPGKQAEVRVKIVCMLREVDDRFRYELPVFLTPRYVPEEIDWAEHHIHCPVFVKTPPYKLTIGGTVSGFPFKLMRSPTHLLDVISKNAEGVCTFAASGSEIYNSSSFILELEPAINILPLCESGLHPDGTRSMYLMMQPEFDYPPDFNDAVSELIFILDCSDSMQGDYFNLARTSLETCLKWLTPGCRFNICLYGDECRMLADSSLIYNSESLAAASAMLDDAVADMGGSELKSALRKIFADPAYASREIVLFTDGDMYNTNDIIEYVKTAGAGVRFYTFGIGSDSPQQLVRGLARETGGLCEIIEPYDLLKEKALRQLSRIFQPRVTGLAVSAINAEVDDVRVEPAALYDGDTLRVLAEVKNLGQDAAIVVKGLVDDRVLLWKLPIMDLGTNELIPGLVSSGVVDADRSLVAVAPAADSEPAYYPSFRPVPIVNSGIYNRAGTKSLIHEETTGYGESLDDLLLRQQADGSFGSEAETETVLLRLKRLAEAKKYLKVPIAKATRHLQKKMADDK